MISLVEGPLVVQPQIWTLVFSREATSRLRSWLAFGRYKHVRAFAYVPFLHVWVFYDVHLSGTDIFIAADGEPAQRLIAQWIVKADLVRMRRLPGDRKASLFFGFCVPAIKRLIGLRCVSLRPDALYRQCLKHGATPFEAVDESTKVRSAAA